MPITNTNAALKIERAHCLGWSPALPPRFGPGRWLRLSKRERRVIRANLRRLQINNAWRPVVAAGEGGAVVSALNKASGGPAFPYAFQHEDSSHFTSQGFAPGMSLRDWFAGQAMDGDVDYWRRHLAPPMNSREHAKFAHADAMLAARTKGAAS